MAIVENQSIGFLRLEPNLDGKGGAHVLEGGELQVGGAVELGERGADPEEPSSG